MSMAVKYNARQIDGQTGTRSGIESDRQRARREILWDFHHVCQHVPPREITAATEAAARYPRECELNNEKRCGPFCFILSSGR